MGGEAFEKNPMLAAQAKMGALLSILVALVAISTSSTRGLVVKQSLGAGKSQGESEAYNSEEISPVVVHEDLALEDIIVQSTVKRLNMIHQTEEAVERRISKLSNGSNGIMVPDITVVGKRSDIS